MTTGQLGMFDLPAGRVARDDALARVEDHAADEWINLARDAVYQTARDHLEFTSDDVWQTGLERPREPRALGPVLLWAARIGIINRTDRTRPSAWTQCHTRPVRVWTSNVRLPGVAL